MTNGSFTLRARAEKGAEREALEVIYEDGDLLVVNKPRAVHSVTLREEDPPTLADMIAHYCAACVDASPDPREAGLVQRLDFYTSGLVLAAKTRECWKYLREELFQNRIEKSYRAIVEGIPKKKQFTIDFAIVMPKNAAKVLVLDEKNSIFRKKSVADMQSFSAMTAVEFVRAWQQNPDVSEVMATGTRMRRHQVRAHLAAVGHPLLGDELYGAKLGLSAIKGAPSEGFLLHAERICFALPNSVDVKEFSVACEYFAQTGKI